MRNEHTLISHVLHLYTYKIISICRNTGCNTNTKKTATYMDVEQKTRGLLSDAHRAVEVLHLNFQTKVSQYPGVQWLMKANQMRTVMQYGLPFQFQPVLFVGSTETQLYCLQQVR